MQQRACFIFLILSIFSAGCEINSDDSSDSFNNSADTADSSKTTSISNDRDTSYIIVCGYHYVRVSATEAAKSETLENPGPDIDAVILNQGGANIEATSVELLTDMSAYTNYKPRDVSTAGIRIDAFTETDPADITASSTCATSSDGFVSIGGTDAGEAAAIWTFPSAVEHGDTLYVVEVGGCRENSREGATSNSEAYSVEVSISTTVDANWQSLGSRVGDGPVMPFVALGLPQIPLGN